MARLFTAGAEAIDYTADGLAAGTSTATYSSTQVRTGARSYLGASGGAGTGVGAIQTNSISGMGTLGRTYYVRAYFYWDSLPTGEAWLMLQGDATPGYRIVLKSDNKLYLQRGISPVDVGSPSPAVSAGVWHRIEMAFKLDTGSLDYGEARLNGVSFASETGANVADNVYSVFSWTNNGNAANIGANKNTYWDDLAINDDQGANQNSWPGSGNVVLLKPTADSAVGTGWTLGTGTAFGGNGFAAEDNTPPVGVADLAVGSDPKQIRNASSNANTAYDATMTTYTAAGIPATVQSINVVDPIVATAAPVTTSAKQGTVGMASNPAITAIALGAGGTAGAFWSGVTAGTFPTGWKISHSTVTYNPAVTLGTAPVMRINQVTSSTRIAMVCFMGIYVDYTPWEMPTVVTPRLRPS